MSHYLVAGAGPIGRATATHLADRGDTVILVSRSGRGPAHDRIDRVSADAADPRRMRELATGSAAVFNCLNPAYHRWPTDWPPMAQALLAAAERAEAVLVTASNLYGYGPVSTAMTENLPLAATGPKGRVRASMYADALAAHRAGRTRTVEVRGSDYVGPGAESHLGDRVVPRVLAGKSVSVIGNPDAPHTWTYTDDMARMLVMAADDERAWGRAWHAPSNPPRTQREAVADLARAAGVAPVKVSAVPSLALRTLGLVNPTIRELQETVYQFTDAFVMDSSDAQRTFGLHPTPWPEVLEATLRSYGWSGSRSAA